MTATTRTQTEILGNREADLLVYLHGWPDRGDLFRELASSLGDEFCHALITLPGFEPGASHSPPDFEPLLAEIRVRLTSLLTKLNKKSFILVGHDWGAHLVYRLESSDLPGLRAIVTMDVGPTIGLEQRTGLLFIVSYQWFLIALWGLRFPAPRLSNAITQGFARLMRAPTPQVAEARTNAFYFYLWRDLLLGRLQAKPAADCLPKVPCLYLYGEKKPCQFHSREWLELLARQPGCEVHGLASAGHWLMRDAPAETTRYMRDWLRGRIDANYEGQ